MRLDRFRDGQTTLQAVGLALTVLGPRTSLVRMSKRLACTTILASAVYTYGIGTATPARAAQPDHRSPANSHARATQTPKRHAVAHPAPPANEDVTVTGGIHSSTGVTNTTPGGGMLAVQTAPKSISAVTRDFIAKRPSNTTPLALLASMPAVAYARSDPYGQVSGNLTIRGMNNTQIGMLVDGVPLIDNIYLGVDPVGQSPDSENITSVAVIEGSPDISSPNYNAVGAEIRTTVRDPSHHMGGMLESSYGTYNMKKEFVRFDTGEIGHTGIRAFASYSYSYNQFWQTPGSLARHHVDAKLVKEWGHDNKATVDFFWGSYSTAGINGNGGKTPTKAAFEADGTSSLYYNTDYTAGTGSYWQLVRRRNSTMSIAAPVHLHLAKGLSWDVTPYFVSIIKDANYPEAISPTNSYYGTEKLAPLSLPDVGANGKQTVEVVDPQYQSQLALMNGLTWTYGRNTFRAGYMYSYLNSTERANYAAASAQGLPANAWGRYGVTDSLGRVISGWDIVYRQQLNALYLDDTLKFFHDRLKINAGFKEVMMQRWVSNLIPGANPYKNGGNYAVPLPQFSASFDITPNDQIYINGTTAFKAPDRSEAYIDIYDASSPNPIQSHPENIKPEYSIGEEIGYRHKGLVNVYVAGFNYNLTNHDVLSTSYVNGALVNAPINLGGVTTRGAQIELGMRPWHHFSPYLSGAYVHAITNNNFRKNGDLLQTAGKTLVNTPTWTGAIGLSYDNGTYFGTFNLNYIGKRYSTFINDESVPGYVTSDITVGYRMKSFHISGLEVTRPQLQLNFLNIGNNIYYAGASGLSSNAKTTKGIYGTTISGSAPTYQIGGGFAMVGTVTAGF
ncbi:TonB-dependent receptor [Ameyamaea chiangmaiensis NBRC 103196]|uniref:TonB-dependent receptor n=1 Tax=Ameyamaea chiangmaiensis TaxID=442969 RepID=A0A850P6F8_9PROT|nr:TonB-dependent receptor [Ameyamaea chiangmaiensis]MBS4074732.1 TonB-dependent receptor [Ameyamaea chiangmaiensis]NVN40225.1 TonB-dependent receptor [Ameyamaea chiangmaiensis]GBQ62535.1 TonB-dependent receptor [Ameyamaea chiangmaiensis NBRC 103196]